MIFKTWNVRNLYGSVFLKTMNVKLVLCLIKHYAMETYRGVDIQILISLTLEVSDQLHTMVALPMGKEPLVLIVQEAQWEPELLIIT
jgi:hypothetical protein